LYRSNGAARLDAYWKSLQPNSKVLHRKTAVLGGQFEETRVVLDAKSKLDPENDIQRGPGSFGSLSTPFAPYELFQPWRWTETAPFRDQGYIFQGWETIGGSNCARFQLDAWAGGYKHGEDYQVYWVDLERDGQTIRFEHYENRNLITRMDDVQLQ